ncbi:hypothetical protein VNO77_25946 [Canavalia gladiata]|uniref:Disease resistance protein RPM1 n=1 Tax=Canavalia gladiata TaxID=3824 RepID=A0AAN9KRI3_CANGL
MAETAVLFVLRRVYQLLTEEGRVLKQVHKDFTYIKHELESIQAFIKDADKRAIDESCDTNDGIKTWVKQLRELSFRIEDVIDEYIMDVAHHHHPRCISTLHNIAHQIKTLMPRHRVAAQIQEIKLSISEVKERSERYNFESSLEQGSTNLQRIKDVKWRNPHLASLFIEEDEVIGFENQRDQVVGWLVNGARDRSVVSVVGMGGLGKTTLAKKVFDNQQVKVHFDCHAFVIVSQSYTLEALLIDMMKQFSKETKEPLPQGINTTDKMSLITIVRHYLQHKRYVIFFDDVWNVDFWDEIQHATLDNKVGSRIVITTRNLDVANYCKKDSYVQMHKLQPLPPNKAWELFCKRAFQLDFNGNCPSELRVISDEIVQRCKGLPLAIVAIGGLLSTKDKTIFEWKKLCQNLSLELDRNPHLANLTRVLALSFDDLPYYLKSCILYFGIYPEDYSISSSRLIRQWIAEGFVKQEEGKTLEEVAEEYLTELIHRSLVQVSNVRYDGKVTSCQIHDLLRAMIIKKMKDISFCHVVHENYQPISDAIIRRLAIATSSSDVMRSIEHSPLRSLYIFNASKLPKHFVSRFFSKSKLLKVLDLEGAWLDYVPEDLGNIFHLKYLSLRYTNVKSLPKSIGKLQNLETLNLKETLVRDLPSEINRLKKLRHLLVYCRKMFSSINGETGLRLMEGIGGITVLQKLYHVEVDHGGLNLIIELKKLRQLRKLGLKNVRKEYRKALSLSIQEMNFLETLHISAITEDEIIDMQFFSSLAQLRKLHLFGRLEKMPNWVPRLEYLVRLSIRFSKLKDDPLKSLKDLPNLLRLAIVCDAYVGEMLHFEVGFMKLKKLYLVQLKNLSSIVIDNGALPALTLFELVDIPKLKEIPSDLHQLNNLKYLYLLQMPYEFNQSIDPHHGCKFWVIKHVPIVYVK